MESYDVMWSQSNNKQGDKQSEQTYGNTCSLTIKGLKPNTKYFVWVKAICNTNVAGEPSDPVPLATAFDNSAVLTKKKNLFKKGDESKGIVSIYTLPLRNGKSSQNFSTFQVFPPNKTRANDRVIMVFGATGAGKSTLINRIVNYVFKVEWEDKYRVKIINEKGENQDGGQAHSQTQYITSYTINQKDGFELGYALTIIDTPGFGDTRGIEQDNVIVQQVRDFFFQH